MLSIFKRKPEDQMGYDPSLVGLPENEEQLAEIRERFERETNPDDDMFDRVGSFISGQYRDDDDIELMTNSAGESVSTEYPEVDGLSSIGEASPVAQLLKDEPEKETNDEFSL